MIEARLRHQYAHAPMPGPKTEQPLATGPSADTPKLAASPSGYAAEMTHCHTRLKVAFAFQLIFA